jgi:hypothetical protein
MARGLTFLVRVPPLLLAILFSFLGVRAMTSPDRVAAFFGYDLPDGGLGLSSMIGHSASWALTIAACLLLGLIRKERIWFYPPMMLFGIFALGRIAATLLHGAPAHPERVLAEFLFAGLLFLASRQAAKSDH